MNNERSLAKEITEGFEALKSMRNNEPVAWMLVDASWNDFCRYSSYPSEGAIPLYTHPVKELTDKEINIVAILQDAEIVPVGHEIWKTGEEFNKYKKIVLATAKALRKPSEK